MAKPDEKLIAALSACVVHARDLLESAKLVQASGRPNIAYHSPAAVAQFGSVPGFFPSAQSQRPAAAGLSRDGSNKATIAAFLAQQARSFEISLLRAREPGEDSRSSP